MGIMSINKRYVLQIVDIGTRFSAAKFVTDKSAETVWNTFLSIWVLPYTGVPHIIRHDQGSEVINQTFRTNCASHGIEIKAVPIESPWSMGIPWRIFAL